MQKIAVPSAMARQTHAGNTPAPICLAQGARSMAINRLGQGRSLLRVHRGVEGGPAVVCPQADGSNDGYRKDKHKADQHSIFDKSGSTLIIVEVTYESPEFFHLKNSCLSGLPFILYLASNLGWEIVTRQTRTRPKFIFSLNCLKESQIL